MGTLRAGARLWWVVGWELLGAVAWALHCRQIGGQAGRDTSGSVVGGRTACLGRLCLATGECAERRGAGRGRWGSGLCPQSSSTWPLGAFPHQAWLSLSRCSTGLQGSLPAPQTAPLEPAVSAERVGPPGGVVPRLRWFDAPGQPGWERSGPATALPCLGESCQGCLFPPWALTLSRPRQHHW